MDVPWPKLSKIICFILTQNTCSIILHLQELPEKDESWTSDKDYTHEQSDSDFKEISSFIQAFSLLNLSGIVWEIISQKILIVQTSRNELIAIENQIVSDHKTNRFTTPLSGKVFYFFQQCLRLVDENDHIKICIK